ncbi:unnamed protein product [Darwinula stevensoni]|uniref:Uncharacterized protein n=1 Tax=Darwinula stevensoni TaxID=69355 RepID=A0A7R9AAT5_9CRUS|nr:unnamed protein product [Darwinula stevensoni]CAG0898554.1 unnamed protein product [Darwinula stevensoni]
MKDSGEALLDLDKIFFSLSRKQIIKSNEWLDMVQEKRPKSKKEKVLFLHQQIRCGGDMAFPTLLECLKENKYEDIVCKSLKFIEMKDEDFAKKLRGDLALKMDQSSSLHDYAPSQNGLGISSIATLTGRNVNIPDDQVYKLESVPPGQVLIVNIREFDENKMTKRIGSEKDRDRIEKLFKSFGFSVRVTKKEDVEKLASHLPLEEKEALMGYIKLEEMVAEINDFAEKVRGDCCVVVIMSHGDQGPAIPDPNLLVAASSTESHGAVTETMREALKQLPFVVYSSDKKPLLVEWIIQKFSTVEALKGKPKIFIIQACRADKIKTQDEIWCGSYDGGIPIDGLGSGSPFYPDDTFIATSTFPYHVSVRPTKGSWFIQAICDVFEAHSNEMDRIDFLSLMREVHKKVADKPGNFGQRPQLDIRGSFKLLFFK